MRLRYSPQARRDLDAIAQYILERNPAASKRVGDRIRRTAELLSEFPLIGHPGILPGTREFVVPGLPYIIIYRVDPGEERAVVIVGIHHGAQDRRS
jgi:toxin ParE1/3/4